MATGNNGGPNWLGLLRWSIAHSDGTAPSNFSTMNETDRLWLERVMKEAVRDDAQRMNEIMLKIKETIQSRGSFEGLEEELEELRDIVEQVDMAQIFTKYGGCAVLLQLIEQDEANVSSETKALAASIIATVAQNNLTAQDAILKSGVIDKLVGVFLQSNDPLLSAKILFALSCSIRGHPEAEEYFVQKFSDLVMAKALQSRVESIVSRAAFLANALITSDYSTVPRIAKLALLFVPSAFQYLSAKGTDLKEHVYAVLTTLLQTNSGYVLVHTNYEQSLIQLLQQREQQLQLEGGNGAISEEELLHEQQLITTLRLRLQQLEENYPTSTARDNHQIARKDLPQHPIAEIVSQVSNESTSVAQQPAVLLIAPPSLEASSQAP